MAERRSLTPNHLSGSPPVSRPFPVLIPPPRCAMSAPAPAAMAEELVAARQKRMKMHREQEAAAAASSESPRPPATPDSKPEPPAPVAPETLTSPAAAAGKERKRKEVVAASALVKAAVLKEEKMKRKRSKHEEAAPTPSRSAASTDQDPKYSSPFDFHAFLDQFRYKPERRQGRNAPSLLKTPPRYRLVKEAVQNEEEMKRKQSKHVEAAAIPSPSAAAQILEVPAEGATARKERMRDKVLQGQSDQPPVPDDVHPQVGKAAADDGVSGNQSVSRSGKPPVQTGSEILKMRIETLKQQQTPQGFVPTMANLSSTDQDPKYSSPFDFHAFFDQFRYKPEPRQGRNAPSLLKTPPRYRLVKEVMRNEEEMKRKQSKHAEAAAIPSPSAAAQILEVAAEEATARKERMRDKVLQGQSGQPPVPVDVRLHVGEAAAHGGFIGSQSVKMTRSGKPRVLTNKERMRIEVLKQQQKPQGFIPPMANFNSIEQDPKYSSSFGAFFDQFSYKPEHQQGHNAPSVPKMPYRPARPSTRDRPPSLSDQLTANETFMAAKTTISDTEQPHSASASGSQEEVKVKGKKGSGKKMDGMKKPRKPVLTAAEKRSDMYRRLPLNELVIMPCSPHELLQERYADDPWKVIVICMLLNLTQGKQVREKVEGFFERYPDAQTAYTADPEMMAEYLRPLGLQNVKTNRIQKFSKAYVGEEWEYITELCGVGKYAADAYAIFCAGRPADVVPEDHKLVDYWKFVCP